MFFRKLAFILLSFFFNQGYGEIHTHLIQLLKDAEPEIIQTLEDYQVPGLAIGIVVGDEVIYAEGFGYKDIEKKEKIDADTLFQVGSCTKAFTAFLAGTFVDAGLIYWDQPVIDLLPQFRLKDEYATLHTTIRDMLSHRSGLPRHALSYYGSKTMKREEIIDKLKHLDTSYDLRVRYQYGDLMYLAVACALERVSGQGWEEMISERILRPLQMNDTFFTFDQASKKANMASPYIEKSGKLYKMPFRDFSVIGPAGGLYSNVKDLGKWLTVHLNGGKSLISPVSLQEMHSAQTVVNETPATKEAQIFLSGMGWNIIPYRGYYYVSHDGGVDGFTSVAGFFPHEKLGIVVLANKNLTLLGRYLSTWLIDKLLGIEPRPWLKDGLEAVKKSRDLEAMNKEAEWLNRKKGTSPTHPLNSYTGCYRHPGYGELCFEIQDGKLIATLNDLSCKLDHWHYDVFVLSEEEQLMLRTREGMKFSFHTDVTGDIDSVSVPFEPTTSEIVFTKEKDHSLSVLSYLKQFVGIYEIYGYTVEISLRGATLCGILPGQPMYEFVPDGENRFYVKSLGYAINFVLGEKGRVEKAMITLPYGSFTATPKY